MVMQQQDFQKKWSKIIAKAWSDPAYKKKLLENPEATLAAEGITFPKGTQVQIHKQDEKIVHLSFPEKPEGELSEEKLLKVAAGFCCKFGGSW